MSTSPLHVELSEEMAVSHTGPEGVEFHYVPVGGVERREPPYDELDPGIRETVRFLYENGFNPCDSGDGVTKVGEMGCALDFPHVFMLVSSLDDLRDEADRLNSLLEGKGIWLFNGPMTPEEADELGVVWEGAPEGVTKGYITASYSPGQPAVLELGGVTDAILQA